MKRKVTRFQVLVLLLACAVLTAVLLPVAEEYIFDRRSKHRAMCIAHLRYLAEAKAQWVISHGKIIGDDVDVVEIMRRYVTNSAYSICPSGGSYSLGEVGMRPKCSLGESHSHVLPKTPLR